MSSYIDIIIRGINQANAVFKQLDGDSKLTAKSLLGLAKAAGVVSLAYKGFDYLKDAVTDTVAYAEEVRDLSRALGINAEESSKLIQLADDMKIDLRQLQMAFRFALNKGVDPSIDGLKKLAVEYQAIEDPIEKAQFAMENFGTRGGLEMQKVLELSAEAIDEMAASAEAAGLVLSDEAAQSAREYEIAMDGLSDSAEGLKITIGNSLIPVLTDLANELNRVMSENQQMNKMVDQTTLAVKAGLITQKEQALLINEVATGTKDYNVILKLAAEAELRLRDDRREGIGAMQDALTANEELQTATEELAAAEEEYRVGVLNDAIAAINDSNLGLAEKLRLTEELKLASGELTKEEILLKDAIGFLTKMLDDGKLTEEEYIGLVNQLAADGTIAAEIVKGLGNAVSLLPDSKDIHINVKYHKYGEEPGPGVPLIGPPGPPDTPNPGGTLQFGGPVLSGQSYLVGERGPELFVPGASGQVVNNWNLTINEAGNRGNVVMDFEIMKALARA